MKGTTQRLNCSIVKNISCFPLWIHFKTLKLNYHILYVLKVGFTTKHEIYTDLFHLLKKNSIISNMKMYSSAANVGRYSILAACLFFPFTIEIIPKIHTLSMVELWTLTDVLPRIVIEFKRSSPMLRGVVIYAVAPSLGSRLYIPLWYQQDQPNCISLFVGVKWKFCISFVVGIKWKLCETTCKWGFPEIYCKPSLWEIDNKLSTLGRKWNYALI